MRAWILAFLVATAPALGADGLASVAAALTAARAEKSGLNENYGVGPATSVAKHALRSWIELALKDFAQEGDVAALSARLNAALTQGGLACEPVARCVPDPDGIDFNAKGYAGVITIERRDLYRYLVVTTQLGMNCGYDESVYIYEWRDKAWKLLLQHEANDYHNGTYNPQTMLTVELSPANIAWNEPAKTPPLVVMQGYSPWCTSNWRLLSTRVWRASFSNPTPKPLLDRADSLFIGDDPAIAKASITPDDLVMEWRGDSIDEARLVRVHVTHYRIGAGDKLIQIAPLALSPQDFVEEWLTGSWPDVSGWGEHPDRLQAVHRALHRDHNFGEFDGPARRCRKDATLWQVAFSDNIDGGKWDLDPKQYFVVRWMAPYRFTLVSVSTTQRSDCDQDDPVTDNLGTLFPLQDWR